MISDFIIIIVFLLLYSASLHIWLHHQMYKNLSKKLAWDEALYHSIFDQAPIGICLVNDKNFKYHSQSGKNGINSVCMQILGRTHQELERIEWPDITHPDDLQKDLHLFDRFQKGEISNYTMEKRFIRP